MNVRNVRDTPCVIDDQGHTLAGGTVADLDPDTDRVKTAVALGWLRLEPPLNPQPPQPVQPGGGS